MKVAVLVGVNCTLKVQVPAGLTLAGQLFVCAKSGPEIAMLLMASAEVPALVRVTGNIGSFLQLVGTLLVVSLQVGKVSLSGAS